MVEKKLKQSIKDMKGFKSPDDIWANIEKDLPAGASGAGLPFYRRRWPVLIAAVALMGLIGFFFLSDESTNTREQKEVQSIQNPSKNTPEPKLFGEQKQKKNTINTEKKTIEPRQITSDLSHKEPTSALSQLSKHDEGTILKKENKNLRLAASEDDLIKRLEPLQVPLSFLKVEPGIKSPHKIDLNLPFLVANKYRPNEVHPVYTLSAFYVYTGETYQTKNNIPHQFRMSMGGIFISRHFSKFYLQTGLSLAYSRDKGERVIQYSRYEKIDEYQYVDSVAVDPVTYQRSYFTITVDVFDSVSHTASNVLENRYQYLQLPIYLGYNLYSGNRYFAGVIMGGTFTKEINKQEVLVAFPYNGEITNTIPGRRDYNIRFSAGLYAGIKFNTHWSFAIRPEIGRNLHNWYVGDEIKPNSGLHSRIGFGLNYTF